jgi:hypothetical protein
MVEQFIVGDRVQQSATAFSPAIPLWIPLVWAVVLAVMITAIQL